MFERVIHMMRKEFIQAFRDLRMRFLIFVAPVIQLLIFGYAVNTDVRNITTAVEDFDNSATSRELMASFVRSGYFSIVAYTVSDADAGHMIDTGEARVVFRINKGFENDLLGGRSASLQVLVDGTDSLTASVVLSYATSLAEQYSSKMLISRMRRTLGGSIRQGGVVLEARAWFNDNLESRDFFIPGVFGLLVGLMTLMLTSMAVVREKEIGTMEQIIVTPIRPAEFILGKSLPFVLIGFVDVIIVLVFGVFWFGVPIRGSIPLLFLCMGLYVMTTLGVGLLISTVSNTQQQAMISTFFFFFPSLLLSGFIFPIESMPKVIQIVTYFNPLRYLLVIIRGIFLKGTGVTILWPQMVALALIGLATLTIASKRFRKTLA
jgi:ABC-2 type transport system permease protein